MIRAVSWWLSVVALAIIGVAVYARLFEQEAGPLAIMVAFMPWFTIACVIPIALALIARAGWLAAISTLVLALLLWWQIPIFTSDSGGDPALRVATVNSTFGEVDPAALVQLVKDRQVDILAVQELTPEAVTAFRAAGLDADLPFSKTLPADGFNGIGLWSRYPMTADALTGFVGNAIQAEITTEAGDFTVVAAHPAAPGLFNHTLWSQDLARLAVVLSGEIGPTITLGDFNATRDHAGFREFERLGYRDAADQAGTGFSPTFPEGRTSPWPLVAIDHVMVRDTNLTALLLTTVSLPGADHRAVVVQYGPKSD